MATRRARSSPGFFNGDGEDDCATSVAIEGDGKIVAGGYAYDPDGDGHYQFALARYNTDGSLDSNFNSSTGGTVTGEFGGNPCYGYDVVIQLTGKIIEGGASGTNFILVRYNTDGTQDTGFGTGSTHVANTTVGNNGYGAVALDSSDNIIVGGCRTNANGDKDFALRRFTFNGTVDTSFAPNATGNRAITDFSGGDDIVYALAVQSDGEILAAGTTYNASGGFDFGLARYNPDGSLDDSFGTDGLVTTDFEGGTDLVTGMALQSDGQIVVAGPSTDETVLARYSSGLNGQNIAVTAAESHEQTGENGPPLQWQGDNDGNWADSGNWEKDQQNEVATGGRRPVVRRHGRHHE